MFWEKFRMLKFGVNNGLPFCALDFWIRKALSEKYLYPISFPLLENFLKICSTKTPYRNPNSEVYQQIDGISIGIPPGPTFSKLYASNSEEAVFKDDQFLKPQLYRRHTDVIFFPGQIWPNNKIEKNTFEDKSCLIFF